MLVALHMVVFMVSATIGYLVTDHTNTPELQAKAQIQSAQLGEDSASQMDRLSRNEAVWEMSADGVASSKGVAQ